MSDKPPAQETQANNDNSAAAAPENESGVVAAPPRTAAAANIGTTNSSNASNKANNEKNINWLQFSQNCLHANPQLHQAAAVLHSMDDSLTCFLCKDIYTIPVSIQPCHHSFCNSCIRDALQTQQEQQQQQGDAATTNYRCPICHTRLDLRTMDMSQCIVLNRSFEETARHYRTLRPLLQQALRFTTHPQPPLLEPSRSSRKRAAAAAGGDATPTRKSKSNAWIRHQFDVEWNEAKQTWSFVCRACRQSTLRSKEQKWNVSKLTEHLLQRCRHVTDAMKEQAVFHSQAGKRMRRTQAQGNTAATTTTTAAVAATTTTNAAATAAVPPTTATDAAQGPLPPENV